MTPTGSPRRKWTGAQSARRAPRLVGDTDLPPRPALSIRISMSFGMSTNLDDPGRHLADLRGFERATLELGPNCSMTSRQAHYQGSRRRQGIGLGVRLGHDQVERTADHRPTIRPA